MKDKTRCASCGREIDERSIVIMCPRCGKNHIARCSHCKRLSTKYKCDCGFEGP